MCARDLRRVNAAARLIAAALLAATAAFALPGPCGTASAQVVEGAPVRHVTVTINKSKTLNFATPFASAVIGSPDIADLLPMSDHSVYIQGKKIGTTNISVFDATKRLVGVVDLEVALDTGSLRGKIVESTGGRGIAVGSAYGQVVLSGQASDSVAATRAVEVASGLAGKDTPIINAMTVAPSQQVMLKVRFLEVDRTVGRDLGVNFFGNNKNGAGFTGLGSAQNSGHGALDRRAVALGCRRLCRLSGGGRPIRVSAGAGHQHERSPDRHVDFGAGGQGAGEDPRRARISSSQSGQKASFFAGSQVPIPTVQPGTIGTTPTVTVQYVSLRRDA